MQASPPKDSLSAQLSALLAECETARSVFLEDDPSASQPAWLPECVLRDSEVGAISKRLEPPRAALAILSADWLQAAAKARRLERDLAALRDLYAEGIVAIADTECPLAPSQWRALGFRPWWHDADSGITLQGFNLYDYKQRPDWLNAKYWANPELWDVYRW